MNVNCVFKKLLHAKCAIVAEKMHRDSESEVAGREIPARHLHPSPPTQPPTVQTTAKPRLFISCFSREKNRGGRETRGAAPFRARRTAFRSFDPFSLRTIPSHSLIPKVPRFVTSSLGRPEIFLWGTAVADLGDFLGTQKACHPVGSGGGQAGGAHSKDDSRFGKIHCLRQQSLILRKIQKTRQGSFSTVTERQLSALPMLDEISGAGARSPPRLLRANPPSGGLLRRGSSGNRGAGA